jgi:hypothetical protein
MERKTNKGVRWNLDSNEPPLKLLSRIADEQRRKIRPTVPEHEWGKKPIFRDNTSNELTKTIISFIQIIGGQAERINSMGRQITRNRKAIWVYRTGTNGTADISTKWGGMSIKIEVKATRGEKQSENQKNYQQVIDQAGGIYIIALSYEGFLFQFFKAVEGRNS